MNRKKSGILGFLAETFWIIYTKRVRLFLRLYRYKSQKVKLEAPVKTRRKERDSSTDLRD